ncbi:hypothetical protein OIU78_013398 [Salix suchowensis]|nr:hypothetical protein OIU78_013398 [Salix suchowensis]
MSSSTGSPGLEWVESFPEHTPFSIVPQMFDSKPQITLLLPHKLVDFADLLDVFLGKNMFRCGESRWKP